MWAQLDDTNEQEPFFMISVRTTSAAAPDL